MRRLIFISLLLLSGFNAFSQVPDLIVTVDGDSIACKIDSVANNNIYFEFIQNNRMINTFINLDKTVDYKYDVIDMNMVHFRLGTSYIEYKPQITEEPRLLKDIQRNSIYLQGYFLFYGLNYERFFPVNQHLGILLGVDFVGVIYDEIYSPSFVNARGTIVMGGPKNFLELSFLYPSSQIVEIGFRYQSKKGFLLKLGSVWMVGRGSLIVGPGIAMGYSF